MCERTLTVDKTNDQESFANVFDEILRVALIWVVDDELTEQQSSAIRAMCSQHAVVDDVVGGTDVTVTAVLGAWRSAQLTGLTSDVRVTKDHPNHVHVQRLTSADTSSI